MNDRSRSCGQSTDSKSEARLAKPHRSYRPGGALVWIAFMLCALAGQAAAQSQCKKVPRQALVADIERYKKDNNYGFQYKWELINCREALPVLKEYGVDPDPHLRGLVGDFLSRNPSLGALRILVAQVQKYPLDANVVHHITAYPCADFRKADAKRLTAAIVQRLKARRESVNPDELHVLGCLAPKDQGAKQFLEEMRGDAFPTGLDAESRKSQLAHINYALAEVNDKAAVASALSEIEALAARGTSDDVQALIREGIRRTNNCVLLNRFASFINDRREGPTIYVGGGPKTLQLRYGDIAVLAFTNKFGARVTGYEYKDDESQRHTDAELEQIYRKLKRHLARQCGKNSNIAGADAAK